MVIFNDLSLQTRSDVPNSDWTGGKAKYVVADGSELAQKILSYYKFEPIEDENGNLIDVAPISPVLETEEALSEAEDLEERERE